MTNTATFSKMLTSEMGKNVSSQVTEALVQGVSSRTISGLA